MAHAKKSRPGNISSSNAVLGLFSRIDALGIDPKQTAIRFLALRKDNPNYDTMRRLCVAELGLRGLKFVRESR